MEMKQFSGRLLQTSLRSRDRGEVYVIKSRGTFDLYLLRRKGAFHGIEKEKEKRKKIKQIHM